MAVSATFKIPLMLFAVVRCAFVSISDQSVLTNCTSGTVYRCAKIAIRGSGDGHKEPVGEDCSGCKVHHHVDLVAEAASDFHDDVSLLIRVDDCIRVVAPISGGEPAKTKLAGGRSTAGGPRRRCAACFALLTV